MWKPNVWKIQQGEESRVLLHLLDENGEPMNLSGATAIAVEVKNQDSSVLTKPAESGISWGEMRPLFIYGFTFSAEEAAALAVKAAQDIIVKVSYGSKVFRYIMPKTMTVCAPVAL